MTAWTVGDIAGLCAHWEVIGDLPAALSGQQVTGWSIDTRTIQPGECFLALRGASSHGFDHWRQAAERGGAGILVASGPFAADLREAADSIPVIVSRDDNFALLKRVGVAWRDRNSFDVVAITGSSGKTSTKDILASLLAHGGGRRVVKSHANHNNEIGVPLTLLRASGDVDVVICEMGMRGLGQIAYLCEIAKPDVGVVTNAGSAHLALLGSRKNILAAKAEILSGSRVGVLPFAQRELLEMAGPVPPTILTFGELDPKIRRDAIGWANVDIASVDHDEAGISGVLEVQGTLPGQRGTSLTFELPVHGAHQARNLAAATCAYLAVTGSVDGLAHAFHHVEITAGRGDWHPLAGGGVLLDDAYNANPESMRAAIAALVTASVPGRHVAVLGYMAELGERLSPALHEQLGAHAAVHGVDELVVVGDDPDTPRISQAFADITGRTVDEYESVDHAIASFERWLRPGDAVLVKASNSVGLGRLAHAIVESMGVLDPAESQPT